MSTKPMTEEPEVQAIVTPLTALEALNRSEIDVQIATARRHPRTMSHFKERALALATLDEETAGSMFYRLPRDNRTIEGPSVRLAEIVGCSWGNLRYAGRIVDEGREFITAQGICHDLETNNAASVEIRRRISNRHGQRYSIDMIQVTANAAISIAIRQAIFKIIPFAFVKPIYEAAVHVAVGNAETLTQRRTRALEWFTKLGIDEQAVLKLLGRADIEAMTVKDLETLTGLRTALKDGETTVEEAFGRQATQERGTLKLNDLKPGTEPNRGHGQEGFEKPARKRRSSDETKYLDSLKRQIENLLRVRFGWQDRKLTTLIRTERAMFANTLAAATEGACEQLGKLPNDEAVLLKAIEYLRAQQRQDGSGDDESVVESATEESGEWQEEPDDGQTDATI